MKLDPVCPACDSQDWERIASKIYRKSDGSRLDDGVKARYEVLFNVWLPGQDEAEFKSILCRKCGFVAFEPRPDSGDIERKYQYLWAKESTHDEVRAHVGIDRQRSEELYARLREKLPAPPAAILDFGGGTGGMMHKFLSEGYECWVVDYSEETIPGVKRLGTTLDDIPSEQRFDLIISSHVLEHLADFVGMMQRVSGHLTDSGLLYVEVPLEVLKGAPLPVEPVTHVNFFTVPSLRIALERAGIQVLACTETMTTFEGGSKEIAVTAIGRRAFADQPVVPSFEGAADASRRLVQSPLSLRLKRLLAYPELRKRAFNDWGRRNLPRQFFWRFFD